MIRFRLGSFVKFLIGILLLQLATALVTYTAMKTDLQQTAWLFAALALSFGVLVAFWFDSVTGTLKDQTLARQQQRHQREREKLRLLAERNKAEIARQRKRASGGLNLKTGVAVGGLVGVGLTMMLAQFMTLGLLTLSLAGGAALGYGLRARQQRLLGHWGPQTRPMTDALTQTEQLALEVDAPKRKTRQTRQSSP